MGGPHAATIAEAVGIGNVDALVWVSGLDQKACVSKMLVSLDGEPTGLLRFSLVEPLAAADLAAVPADAALAVALKINPLAVFNAYMATVEKIDPKAGDNMLRGIGQMEAMTGLKLRTDILKPLGDNFTLHASLGPMGIPNVTAVLQLKDPAQAAKTFAKLIQTAEAASKMMAEATSKMPAGQPNAPKFSLSKQDASGKTIYTLTANGSVSFCLTEKELIASALPGNIEAYLSRPADVKSLAQSAEVAGALQGETAPTALVYCNTQQIFDKIYPALPVLAMLLQQKGINLDLSTMPSAKAIRGHLTPLLTTVRRTKLGIELDEQQPLPGIGVVSSAPALTALLLPAVQAAREAARRMQSSNNMKMISLTLLNYQAAHGKFPPAYTADKDGKPLLSWRVHILPFLEQNDLYKQFHLDEPWDSEHNKPLIASMPSFYKSPKSAVSGEGKTNYLTVRGEKTVFPGAKGVTVGEITDGASNTIMTVEVSDENAVVWTKPDDFECDEKNLLKGLIGLWAGGFNAGFADGSVRFLSSSIDLKTLNALFTRNGGEAVDASVLNQ